MLSESTVWLRREGARGVLPSGLEIWRKPRLHDRTSRALGVDWLDDVQRREVSVLTEQLRV